MGVNQKPNEVWIVQSRTFASVFDSKESVDRFMGSFPPSVSGGFEVSKTTVLTCDDPVKSSWNARLMELIEDYAGARVETALWNANKTQPEGGVRLVLPRYKAILNHFKEAR